MNTRRILRGRRRLAGRRIRGGPILWVVPWVVSCGTPIETAGLDDQPGALDAPRAPAVPPAQWVSTAGEPTALTGLARFGTTPNLQFSPSDADARMAGYAVATDDAVAVVTAPGLVGYGGADPGQAFVFRKSGGRWTYSQTLPSPESKTYPYFGLSAALCGDSIAIGSLGTVNLYRPNPAGSSRFSWYQRLTGSTNDFGAALACTANLLFVRTPDWSGAGPSIVSVYQRSSGRFSFVQDLPSNNTIAGHRDAHGASLAVQGDTLLIGAPQARLSAAAGDPEPGAVYVYKKTGSGFAMQQRLLPDVPIAGGYFGGAVALDGPTVLIGAPWSYRRADIGGRSEYEALSGAAYLFTESGGHFVQQQVLRTSADGLRHNRRFGQAVQVKGTQAVIGGLDARVEVYEKGLTRYDMQQILERPRYGYVLSFGSALSYVGSTLLVGYPNDATRVAENIGSAWFFGP